MKWWTKEYAENWRYSIVSGQHVSPGVVVGNGGDCVLYCVRVWAVGADNPGIAIYDGVPGSGGVQIDSLDGTTIQTYYFRTRCANGLYIVTDDTAGTLRARVDYL